MNIFLKEALKEALKAYDKGEVPVGCVIVKDNKIIARAHNLRESKNCSTAHAELLCIEKACRKLKSWRLDNCQLYVTLEPCLMCIGAITQARIDKVYIGTLDSKNGCTVSLINIKDIKTTSSIKYEIINDKECSSILSNFFKDLRIKKKNQD